MNYFSLNHKAPIVSFKEAVLMGLAPDNGLYFPASITPLSDDFFNNIETRSSPEIAYETIKQFIVPEIPASKLKRIVAETLSFDFPVVPITRNISALELFHGPTMAFKDVGARFMARCLGYFNNDNPKEVTILVATSGDTGGAVANGFLGVKGVKVVILYPSGKVSEIQEKQLTTLGQNITALEVDGTFDDCQDMVKTAFLDEELRSQILLTSANSINVARWLPQMFYFMFAYKQLKARYPNIVFSVPSGNFGNICAGIMAQQLGLPIKHFIAATNANNVVPNYLKTQVYQPKSSVQTISNAMDVGNPSNFIRITQLYANNFERLKQNLYAFGFSDQETQIALQELYNEHGYKADPHGAVGFLGAKAYLKNNPDVHCVFLETAHPTKFLDVIENIYEYNEKLPTQIQSVLSKKKKSTPINTYSQLKNILLST